MDVYYGPKGRANFAARVEGGEDAWLAATTYEHVCVGCGGQTFLDGDGGALNCTCEDPGATDNEVFLILAGHRERMGTMAEIVPPPPVPASVAAILRDDLTDRGIEQWWEGYLRRNPLAREGRAREHAQRWVESRVGQGGA